jgi:ketosteroid isomerase-like protein
MQNINRGAFVMSGNGPENESRNEPVQEVFDGMLQAFVSKDLPTCMSYFAEDAIVYDPHYPQPRMVGKAAIEQGIAWGMNSLEKPSFKLRHMWTDENSGVAEMDTHHVIKGSMETKFDQLFVCEVRNGKITHLQSYVPYRPHGIAGLIGNISNLVWRLQGKIK